MNVSRIPLLLCCLALLVCLGCEHAYQEVPLARNIARPTLRSEAMVYVPIPPDGYFKKDIAVDSGKLTALAIRDAFAKYVKRAYIGRGVETLGQSLETARRSNCQYVIYATITRWEDRATEFSGRTDKIEIKIEVAEAASGDILHSSLLKGRSRWFTDGGDTPKDLLKEPTEKYAASMFQPVSVPSGLR